MLGKTHGLLRMCFEGESDLEFFRCAGPRRQFSGHRGFHFVPVARTTTDRTLDQCRCAGGAFVADLSGGAQTIEVGLNAASAAESYVLRDGGQDQPEIANTLP